MIERKGNTKALKGLLVLFGLLVFHKSVVGSNVEPNIPPDPKVKIITETIKKLSGSSRSQLAAVKELRNAGEYAIPYMLDAMADHSRKEELPNIIWALPQIGRDAIRPLAAALQTKNAAIKAEIIKALGKIGYPQSLAYLKYIVEKDDSAGLRSLAEQSIRQIDPVALTVPATELFYRLGEKYSSHAKSLSPAMDAKFANIWFWDSVNHRLVREKVDKSCFNELMSMRACEWALKADPEFVKAIGLWKAAYLKVESTGGNMSNYFGSNYAKAMATLSNTLQDKDEQTRKLAVEAIANIVTRPNQIIPRLKIDGLQTPPQPFTEAARKEAQKTYITRSETISSGCIELQEGPYGVPLDATLSEVIEWSKKQGLVTRDTMETEEYYKSSIVGNLYRIETLRKEGFCGWDPNEGKFALEIKLSTKECRFALDHKCSNLVFESSLNGMADQNRALKIRDDLNTLNNPYYVDEKVKHPLVPVFWLRAGYPIDLFDNGDVVYVTDDRIIRNTCRLDLSMPSILNQEDPLNEMIVFFVRTTDGQWKSYAVTAVFVTDTNTHEKIVNTLNNKYGHYRWVKPCELVRKDNRIMTKPSESTELQSKLKHLTGFDVGGESILFEFADGGPPDFLVWRTNIFAYGGYSVLDDDGTDYFNFLLSRTSIFRLFYYDAKYSEEIIKTHITAAEAAIKEYYEKRKQVDKQLKSKF